MIYLILFVAIIKANIVTNQLHFPASDWDVSKHRINFVSIADQRKIYRLPLSEDIRPIASARNFPVTIFPDVRFNRILCPAIRHSTVSDFSACDWKSGVRVHIGVARFVVQDDAHLAGYHYFRGWRRPSVFEPGNEEHNIAFENFVMRPDATQISPDLSLTDGARLFDGFMRSVGGPFSMVERPAHQTDTDKSQTGLYGRDNDSAGGSVSHFLLCLEIIASALVFLFASLASVLGFERLGNAVGVVVDGGPRNWWRAAYGLCLGLGGIAVGTCCILYWCALSGA